MALKAAFIFVAPAADPAVHRNWVRTPDVELLTLAIADYDAIESVVDDLITKEGVKAIELCGGFGLQGAARVARASAGRAAVGVVRFDCHPGLGHKSGDDLFYTDRCK